MTRRTKQEISEMKHECTMYLLRTNLDYKKAYDLMIKECLENNIPLPDCIRGMKDFQKVSQELALQFEREERMKKTDREQHLAKQDLKQQILNITLEQMKIIYNAFKDEIYRDYKLTLTSVYTLKHLNEFTLKDIDQPVLNAFQSIIHTEQYKNIVQSN